MYCSIEFDTSRVRFQHLSGVGDVHDGFKSRTSDKFKTGAEAMQARHANAHAKEQLLSHGALFAADVTTRCA
jgi:hypothetical protein